MIVIGYPIEFVREIASCYNYTECDCNEESRVISFRKEGVRMNVYYTTGTVGTCINHPHRGKTQLFRRDVDSDLLRELFANPRKHTEKGYYRKNVSQYWKTSGKFVSDFARRWIYVCASARLSTDPDTLAMVEDCMNRVSALLWERGSPPSMEAMRHACGSWSAIREMVLQIAEQDGAIGAVKRTDLSSPSYTQPELECSNDCANCGNYIEYCEAYGEQIRALKRKILLLPTNIRKEICNWLVGALQCGYVLVDKNYEQIRSDFSLEPAHVDYGSTFYSKADLKNGMCRIHGIAGEI